MWGSYLKKFQGKNLSKTNRIIPVHIVNETQPPMMQPRTKFAPSDSLSSSGMVSAGMSSHTTLSFINFPSSNVRKKMAKKSSVQLVNAFKLFINGKGSRKKLSKAACDYDKVTRVKLQPVLRQLIDVFKEA